MDQIGRVVALQGDYAVVEVERNRACAKCGICHMGRTDKMFLEVKNVLGADVGKRVLIEMGKSSVLMAGSIVYLLPLLGLIAGVGLAYLVNAFYPLPGSPDWWGIGAGFALFVLTLAGIRLSEPAFRRNPRFYPAMVRIVEDFEEITDYCGREEHE
ncbi:MAG TPA: SoxR reducing system RseC family protein [Bacillota bacterium]|nr:SoxR reducing system RseC family protein [Bacillota bacterium]HPZ90794.1 SoxR reducing system RseC family protein [Bacillota bacterium]HQE01748.1 SoxR reducing system RseC family protein [Bacillota bacterium]